MLEKIIEIARNAGEIALSAGNNKHVTSKEGHANFVTEYDKKIENYVVEKLHALLPFRPAASAPCPRNGTSWRSGFPRE